MVELLSDVTSTEFVREAFQHYKTIAAVGDGVRLLTAAGAINVEGEKEAQSNGILIAEEKSAETSSFTSFIEAIAQHRHGDRILQLLFNSLRSMRIMILHSDRK